MILDNAKLPCKHRVTHPGAFVQIAQTSKTCDFPIDFYKKIWYYNNTERIKNLLKKGLVRMMNKAIYFDMDGTIADLYGVENWLSYLIERNPLPYEIAKPLIRLSALARKLNKLQALGWRIGVVSWLSKEDNPDYNQVVTEAKKMWLKKHLASVHFDDVKIVSYGTPKSTVVNEIGILFDDEERNRIEWNNAGGNAYDVNNILEVLGGL